MKRKAYPLLLLKRALKIYPSVLATALATVLALSLAAFAIIGSIAKENGTRVAIGIVGDTTETFFDIGIDVIKNIDSSRFYIDLRSMSEAEASDALARDEIMGYLVIPDDFIDSIASLESSGATYYIANKPDSLGTVLTREVIDTVSVYVAETQRVAAGLRSFIRANGLVKGDSINEVSKAIITNVLLSRSSLYETEFTGVAGSISTGGYYLVGMLLMLMLLWGISCCALFTGRDIALSKFLYSRGIGSGMQMLCEYAVFMLVTLVTMIVFAVIFGTVTYNFSLGIPELEVAGVMSCVGFVFASIPVIFAVCAMQMMLFEAVDGMVSALITQFLCAVGFGYISGCFYPNYFFPDSVRAVADILPVGAGFAYMRAVLTSRFMPVQAVILIGYAGLFFAVSVALRKKKMAGDLR